MIISWRIIKKRHGEGQRKKAHIKKPFGFGFLGTQLWSRYIILFEGSLVVVRDSNNEKKAICLGYLLKTIRKKGRITLNCLNKWTYYKLWTLNMVTQEMYIEIHFLKILKSTSQDNYIWLVLFFFSLSLDRIIEFNEANTMEITLKYKTTINRNCEYTRFTIVKSLESRNN